MLNGAVLRGLPKNWFSLGRAILCCGAGGLLLIALSGCGGGGESAREFQYVNALNATLRDHVAAVYAKTGAVTNGERVEILSRSHNGRWLQVRDPRGEEGWIEARYLAPESVFAAFAALALQNANLPAQAQATTRASLNMHLQPARQSDHLYQLAAGDKVAILKRASSPRTNIAEAAAPPASNGEPPAPAIAYEDWWLARASGGRTGWVLARMVDLDVPLDVAQYAEGQRIVGAFVLNTVKDDGKQVPQYLLLLNTPDAGAPQDFNQLRVFTWDTRRHRYETAYRERNLSGMLPASAGVEDFGKEGTLPVFTVQARDSAGQLQPRKYKMNGVMVRRVLGPGEQAAVERHARKR